MRSNHTEIKRNQFFPGLIRHNEHIRINQNGFRVRINIILQNKCMAK